MCLFQMSENSTPWTREKLYIRLQSFNTPTYRWSNLLGHPFDHFVKAAVLIPLTVVDGVVEVWLTERSQVVRHDKGHVSFPGGKKDDDDSDAVETSLREAREEFGLLPNQVMIKMWYAVCQLTPPYTLQGLNLIETAKCTWPARF